MAKQKPEVSEVNSAEMDISPSMEEATIEASVTHVECAAEEEVAGKTAGKGILSSICGGVQKGIYTSVYTVTYGAVYGALLVGGLIPVNSVVSEGMRDGFAAARKAYGNRSGSGVEAAELNAAATAA